MEESGVRQRPVHTTKREVQLIAITNVQADITLTAVRVYRILKQIPVPVLLEIQSITAEHLPIPIHRHGGEAIGVRLTVHHITI